MHVRIATSAEAGSHTPRETGVYFFYESLAPHKTGWYYSYVGDADMETTKMTTQQLAKQHKLTVRHDVQARTKCRANRNFMWVVDIEWSTRTMDITYKTDRWTTTFAHRDGKRWERHLLVEMTNNDVRRLIAKMVPLVAKIADGIDSKNDVADLLLELDRAVWQANEVAIRN